ncbi:hypothetical protein AB0M34_25470 [Nocardia sp. NPDC050193]
MTTHPPLLQRTILSGTAFAPADRDDAYGLAGMGRPAGHCAGFA